MTATIAREARGRAKSEIEAMAAIMRIIDTLMMMELRMNAVLVLASSPGNTG